MATTRQTQTQNDEWWLNPATREASPVPAQTRYAQRLAYYQQLLKQQKQGDRDALAQAMQHSQAAQQPETPQQPQTGPSVPQWSTPGQSTTGPQSPLTVQQQAGRYGVTEQLPAQTQPQSLPQQIWKQLAASDVGNAWSAVFNPPTAEQLAQLTPMARKVVDRPLAERLVNAGMASSIAVNSPFLPREALRFLNIGQQAVKQTASAPTLFAPNLETIGTGMAGAFGKLLHGDTSGFREENLRKLVRAAPPPAQVAGEFQNWLGEDRTQKYQEDFSETQQPVTRAVLGTPSPVTHALTQATGIGASGYEAMTRASMRILAGESPTAAREGLIAPAPDADEATRQKFGAQVQEAVESARVRARFMALRGGADNAAAQRAGDEAAEEMLVTINQLGMIPGETEPGRELIFGLATAPLDPVNKLPLNKLFGLEAAFKAGGKLPVVGKYVLKAQAAVGKLPVVGKLALEKQPRSAQEIARRKAEVLDATYDDSMQQALDAQIRGISPETITRQQRLQEQAAAPGATALQKAMAKGYDKYVQLAERQPTTQARVYQGLGADVLNTLTQGVTNGDQMAQRLSAFVYDPSTLVEQFGNMPNSIKGEAARRVVTQALDKLGKLPSMKDPDGFNPAKFQLEAYDTLGSAARELAGVTGERTPADKLFGGVRAWMGEFFLRNPGYIARNAVSDLNILAQDGLLSLDGMDQVRGYLQRAGITDPLITGESLTGYPSKLSKVPGLGWYQNKMGQINTNLENGRRTRAYYAGLQEYRKQNWQPTIDPALRQAWGPEFAPLFDTLEAGFNGALSGQELGNVLKVVLDAKHPADRFYVEKYLKEAGIPLDAVSAGHITKLSDTLRRMAADGAGKEEITAYLQAERQQVERQNYEQIARLGQVVNPRMTTELDAKRDGQEREILYKQMSDSLVDAGVMTRERANAEVKALIDEINQAETVVRAGRESAAKRLSNLPDDAPPELIERLADLIGHARDFEYQQRADTRTFGDSLRAEIITAKQKATSSAERQEIASRTWEAYKKRTSERWGKTHEDIKNRHFLVGAIMDEIQTHPDNYAARIKEISGFNELKGYAQKFIDDTRASLQEGGREGFDAKLADKRYQYDDARRGAWSGTVAAIKKHPKLAQDFFDIMVRADRDVMDDAARTMGLKESALKVALNEGSDQAWDRYHAYADKIWNDHFEYARRRYADHAPAQLAWAEVRKSPLAEGLRKLEYGNEQIFQWFTSRTPETDKLMSAILTARVRAEDLPKIQKALKIEPPTAPPTTEQPTETTPTEPTIPPVTRETVRERLRDAWQQQGGTATDEQVDAVMRYLDARAYTWSKWAGGKAEDWYGAHIAEITSGGEGELAQINPDAPAFKRWFGESKTVDERGAPQVLYHGTHKDFTEFQPGWSYFSEKPEYSNQLARYEDARVIPAFVRIENPIDLTDLPAKRAPVGALVRSLREYGFDVDDTDFPSSGPMYWQLNKKPAQEKLLTQAHELGYDGLVFNDTFGDVEAKSYVAFSPEQIKSAIGNRGTFDPNSPSILEQQQPGARRGAVAFLDDGRAVIRALQAPDVSTMVHEVGHIFRRDLYDSAQKATDPQIRQQLMDDIAAVESWAGVKDGAWSVEAEEKFARAHEEYLATGKTAQPALQRVFEKFKEWLSGIYQGMQGLISGKLTPEMRGVFDRMVAEYPALATVPGAETRVPSAEMARLTPEQVLPRLRTQAQPEATPPQGRRAQLRPGEMTQPQRLEYEPRPLVDWQQEGKTRSATLAFPDETEYRRRLVEEWGMPQAAADRITGLNTYKAWGDMEATRYGRGTGVEWDQLSDEYKRRVIDNYVNPLPDTAAQTPAQPEAPQSDVLQEGLFADIAPKQQPIEGEQLGMFGAEAATSKRTAPQDILGEYNLVKRQIGLEQRPDQRAQLEQRLTQLKAQAAARGIDVEPAADLGPMFGASHEPEAQAEATTTETAAAIPASADEFLARNPGKAPAELLPEVEKQLEIAARDLEVAGLDASRAAAQNYPDLNTIRAWVDTSKPDLPARRTVTVGGRTIYKADAPWTETGGGGADRSIAEALMQYGLDAKALEQPGGEPQVWLDYLREAYRVQKRVQRADAMGKRVAQAQQRASADALDQWAAIADDLRGRVDRDVDTEARDTAQVLVDDLGDQGQAFDLISQWDDADPLKESALNWVLQLQPRSATMEATNGQEATATTQQTVRPAQPEGEGAVTAPRVPTDAGEAAGQAAPGAEQPATGVTPRDQTPAAAGRTLYQEQPGTEANPLPDGDLDTVDPETLARYRDAIAETGNSEGIYAKDLHTAAAQQQLKALDAIIAGFSRDYDGFTPIAYDSPAARPQPTTKAPGGLRGLATPAKPGEMTPEAVQAALNLPAGGYAALQKEVTRLQRELNETMSSAKTYAKARADFSLLDYGDKRGFDKGLLAFAPFSYWGTRQGRNYALRMINNPAVLLSYLRYRQAMQDENKKRGRRSRFEGGINIGKLGGESDVFVDPMAFIYPFANLVDVQWDDADQAKTGLQQAYDWASRFGFRPSPLFDLPIRLSNALVDPTASEEERLQQETAYGRTSVGEVLPRFTAPIQAATAAANIGGPAGVDIEAPLRRALGLQEGEPWDAFRAARSVSDMAYEAQDAVQKAGLEFDKTPYLAAQELVSRYGKGGEWLDMLNTMSAEKAARELNIDEEMAAQALHIVREGTRRATQQRGFSQMASYLLGVRALQEPQGEQMRNELMREQKGAAYNPATGYGSKELVNAVKAVNPALQVSQGQYGALPGENNDISYLYENAQRDEVYRAYDALKDVLLQAQPWNKKLMSQLEASRFAALDTLRGAGTGASAKQAAGTWQQEYQRFVSGGQAGAATSQYQYYPHSIAGATPAEALKIRQDEIMRAVYDTRPDAEQFANEEGAIDFNAYNLAVVEWSKRLPTIAAGLPQVAQVLQQASKEGTAEKLSGFVGGLKAADVDAYKRRNDTPAEAAQRAYFDLVYNPAWDQYNALVSQGTDKSEAYQQTIGSIGPVSTEQLAQLVQQMYGDKWAPDELMQGLGQMTMPDASTVRDGTMSAPARAKAQARDAFWQVYNNEIPPGSASYEVRQSPIVALILDQDSRGTATAEQYEMAAALMRGWTAENYGEPDPEWAQARAVKQALDTQIIARYGREGLNLLRQYDMATKKSERARLMMQSPALSRIQSMRVQYAWKNKLYRKYFGSGLGKR